MYVSTSMDGSRAEQNLKKVCAEAIYYIIDEYPALRHANIVLLTERMVSFSMIHVYSKPVTTEEHISRSKKFIETLCIYLESQSIETIKKAVKESFVKYLLNQ